MQQTHNQLKFAFNFDDCTNKPFYVAVFRFLSFSLTTQFPTFFSLCDKDAMQILISSLKNLRDHRNVFLLVARWRNGKGNFVLIVLATFSRATFPVPLFIVIQNLNIFKFLKCLKQRFLRPLTTLDARCKNYNVTTNLITMRGCTREKCLSNGKFSKNTE